jgi:hypothetical protein
MQISKFKIISLISPIGLLLRPPPAFAQSFLNEFKKGFDSAQGLFSPQHRGFESVIGLVFNITLTAIGTIFMVLLISGAIQYLTNAGNEEGTTHAKRVMVDSLVGLIVTLAAYAIGRFVLNFFGAS